MSKEKRDNICSKLLSNLSCIRTRNDEEQLWMDRFNKLNDEDKRTLILNIFTSQDRIIKQGILTKDSVQLLHLGTFKHVVYRDTNFELKEQGFSREEIKASIIQDMIRDKTKRDMDYVLEASEMLNAQINKK